MCRTMCRDTWIFRTEAYPADVQNIAYNRKSVAFLYLYPLLYFIIPKENLLYHVCISTYIIHHIQLKKDANWSHRSKGNKLWIIEVCICEEVMCDFLSIYVLIEFSTVLFI